jgi:hypothetical protein
MQAFEVFKKHTRFYNQLVTWSPESNGKTGGNKIHGLPKFIRVAEGGGGKEKHSVYKLTFKEFEDIPVDHLHLWSKENNSKKDFKFWYYFLTYFVFLSISDYLKNIPRREHLTSAGTHATTGYLYRFRTKNYALCPVE